MPVLAGVGIPQGSTRPVVLSGAVERYITPKRRGGGDSTAERFRAINNPGAPPRPSGGTKVRRPSAPQSFAPSAPVRAPAVPSATNRKISLAGDQRKGFVDVLFASGAATGDAGYWYEQQADDNDLVKAAIRGLGDPGKRVQIVDYLFASGLAQGEKSYWYQDRGEDANLIATFAAGANAGGGAPSNESDIDRLRRERMEAAIAAIGGDFDFQEGTLKAEIGDLEALYARASAENVRATEFATEDNENQFIERGIFNSGLRAKGLARSLTPIAEGQADLDASVGPGGTQIRDLLAAIRQLVPREAQAIGAARTEAERDQLELQKMIALIEAGLGG